MGCIGAEGSYYQAALIYKCPLNHLMKGIKLTYRPSRLPTQNITNYCCQICKASEGSFLYCQTCKYSICIKHLEHKDFCPNFRLRCFEIQNEYCMKCSKHFYFQSHSDQRYRRLNSPGLICRTCNYVICVKCQPTKHYEVSGKKKNFQYVRKTVNPSKLCFNCSKQIQGGLSCRQCSNCFCENCEKMEIADSLPVAKDQSNLCPICLISLLDSKNIRLGCHHQFHSKCIETWRQRSCPLCRANF